MVGRSETNDLRLSDETVSRHHATLASHPDGVLVTDERSTSGTFVNDVQVRGSRLAHGGDTIRFGNTAVRLIAADDMVTAAVSPTERPVASRAAPAPAGGTLGRTPGPGRGVIRGTVRSATLRTEALGPVEHGFQVLSFSLLTPDGRGVGVEMRGRTLHGPVPHDGQEVDVTGRRSRGVLQATRIRNVDTGETVHPGGMSGLRATRVAMFFIFAIVVIGLIAGGIAFLNEEGLNPLAPTVTVPSVQAGESLGAVDSRLRDAGLRTEWMPDQSSQVPFGTVIRISPTSGTQVRKGSTVKIYENTTLR
jgi:hypothetical protein